MGQPIIKPNRLVANTARNEGNSGGRRSFTIHSKKINNAFLIVFDQYEKAFEELAKV
ncbi:hypothetical protein [Pseudomonas syringae]|uniref:hypothetical protein n=1 Tax=Pseudomonas syringae TaxID=317 RepID=UPI001303FB05|nr:hypothetical protein [Pseudomonas syringae]